MTLASSINPLTDRAAWLAERMNGIGASEAAMVLGMSPYGGAHKLWLLKTGQLAPEPENEAMKLGTMLEPIVGQLYCEATGRTLAAQQLMLRSPGYPYLFATVDAFDSADELVEFKTCGAFSEAGRELGEEGSDEMPFHWVIQAHQQMYCTGRSRCNVAVLVGGQRFRKFTVERNELLVCEMIPRLTEFWRQVKELDPPECLEAYDPATLARLNPECHGEMEIRGELLDMVREWEDAKAIAKQAKEAAEESKAAILQAMGKLEVGHLPDGRVVKRYVEHVKARVHTVDAHTKHYIRLLKGA